MKIITVSSKTHGTKEIFVDDCDFDYLNQYNWFIRKGKNKNTYYAFRNGTVKEGYKVFLMHRQLFGLTNPKSLIDHKDRNGLNNQRNNLRIATNTQNRANCKSSRNTSSKFRGVFWEKYAKKWRAHIRNEGIRKNLGLFEIESDAAVAYNKAAKLIFGEFAYLNII